MVARTSRTMTGAKMVAARARKRGLNASIFKKKKGFGISVTRNK